MQTKIIYLEKDNLIFTIDSLVLFRADDSMIYKKEQLWVENTVYDIENKVLNVYVSR
ncbi:hypothetical protein [uncultured Winogradskyella sp.]|uniref:hypothetical protein n=1 Tax=uncultured Winogradskyella sp. TaxID=395353 RepID=UPI0030DA17EF|tara:strand:+ start:35910 stop:36080 length:171 start_codon:yes stop_codon:yes gene_type:complete